MSSNDNTSTLKSYVDSATGAVQSGIASLTGSASDHVRFPPRFLSTSTQQSVSFLLIIKSSPIFHIQWKIHSNTTPANHPSQQAKADQTRAKATTEHDASQSAIKAGPFTLGSSGAATKDNPDRTQGAWDQTIGSGKETVGNLLGDESLKRQGREQNLQGQGQEAKGQLSDFGNGVGDRVKGTMGSAAAGLTGNREKQERMQDRHDDGKTRQRGAELDMNKSA